ncbi:FtsW/RodA/SpoVE family cell cycle protein [Candidatus Chlorohelix sp.]|uniref:FtsW/RodA/SpoVE family cell cycle protein n=1 Tax=Candidatus Chlorohelix sp. TaxID=3139201 RepID=UPI00303A84C0
MITTDITKPNQNRALVKSLTGGRPDYWLLAFVAVIVTCGTVIIYSASFVQAVNTGPDYNSAAILFKHLTWVAVGLVGLIVAAKIDYHFWRKYSVAAMFGVVFLLLMVLALPEYFAPTTYGAKRWITPLGDGSTIQFQPSEFAKLILIIYAAHWLSSKGDKVRTFWYGLFPFVISIGIIIGLVAVEPDWGTSLVIGFIGLAMFFVAGANLLHLIIGGSFAGVVIAGIIYLITITSPWRLERIKDYLDPLADITSHTTKALMGLGSGGIFGVGLGAGRSKFYWLPTQFTDSIFVVLGEELGLVGAGTVVILFVALAWRGYSIAVHAPDGFGRLVALGITSYIVFQAFLNIAVVSNLVPFTGIPLPFISYGGSSLAISMTAIGLLLNVSKQQVDNPHILEMALQRELERKQRDLLREQRAAARERREAQQKLQQTVISEQENQDLETARKAWEARTAQEKAEIAWREQLETEMARQKAAEQERRDNQRLEQKQNLPTIARKSFLDFESQSDKPQIGGVKLHKPRRDWAKVYNNLARRNNSADD